MAFRNPALKDGGDDGFTAVTLPKFFNGYSDGGSCNESISRQSEKPPVIRQRCPKML